MKSRLVAVVLALAVLAICQTPTILKDAAGSGNGAQVTAGAALKVDGSAVTQPVSNGGTFAVQNTAATPAGTANIGEVVPVPTATTTDSALGCYLVSAASTNSTSCKGSAGNLYGFRMVNTTATLYYLRLYNSSSAPTCSSATGFIESIPIPANTTGAGIVAISPIAIGYTTGIGFCFTGGSSSTDNSNAALGVFGAILYK